MQNILFFIVGIALGFYIKDKTKQSFTPQTPEELNKMRKESKEALSERTEKRKEKILEFMKSEAFHREELKGCNMSSESIKRNKTTCNDIQKLLEVSDQTAVKYLNELERESKIEQIGRQGKGVYYILKQPYSHKMLVDFMPKHLFPIKPTSNFAKMNKTNIKINFSSENGFLLDLEKLVSAPENIQKTAKEKGLIEKTEQHITVIGSGTRGILLEKLKAMSAEEDISQRIKELAQKTEWKYTEQPEFFYITKEYECSSLENPNETLYEKRESIIQIVDLVGLKGFYDELNKILSEKLILPFPHITLYTNSTREDKRTRGIGIYSHDDFKEMNPKKL